MAEITNLYAKNWQAGSVYRDWTAISTSSSTFFAGTYNSGKNWVICVRFQLTGYAKNLVFSWCTGTQFSGVSKWKYKLCAAEDSTLINATTSTAGDGTISPQAYSYGRNSITINGTYAPGTYYLYFWKATDNTYSSIYWITGNSYRAYVEYDEYSPLSTLSASNGTLGTAQTLTITRYDSGYTHSIRYDCGDTSAAIVTKTSSTSISFTPSINLARENTTGTTVSITFTLYTFDGDTEIGTTTKTISCTIPASVVPSCSLSISDVLGYAATYGGYVQNKSKLEIIVTPTLAHNSPIKAYSVTADGKTYNYSDIETPPLENSGTLTVSATVRDARSRTGTVSESITVLPYTSPVISKLAVHRCNADGTENATGSYTRVTYSFAITSLSNKNGKTIKLLYKKSSATTYTSVTLTSAYSATDAEYIFAADDGSSYDVQLSVADNFDTTVRSTTVSTAAVLMHWGADGSSIAFGKIVEKSSAIELGLSAYDKFGTMIGNGLAAYGGGGDSGIDPNTTLEELCLTSHTNAPQGLGTFYYIYTMFYSTKSATAARAQVAVPYKKTGSMYHRYYASGAWASWERYMPASEVKKQRVFNLLDNSDFSNPINQRGATSYSNSSYKYTIDRWMLNSAAPTLTVATSGIVLDNTNGTGTIGLNQRISLLADGIYTAAIKTAEGLSMGIYTVTNGTVSTKQSSGVASGFVGLFSGTEYNTFQIAINAGKSLTIEWAALYAAEYSADELPDYHPKGYGAELRECQRYYYQSWIPADGFTDACPAELAASGWGIPANIYFPVEMRVKPTITVYSDEGTLNVVRIWDNSSAPAITGANRIGKHRFGIGANGTLTSGKIYKFHYSASADL